MPWNGSGVFSRIYSWVADAAAAIDINATRMDTDTNDIATALNNCRTLDGQTKPTAALPMNGFNHTGVGNGTAAAHYAAVGQVQNNSLLFAPATGTGDAITASFSPATTALTDGEQVCVRAASANATTTPTFAPDGLTAHTITRFGGAALVAGDIVANHELTLRYNAANTRWELLNPHNPSLRDTSAAFDVAMAATSSITLTAQRTFTLDVANASRTLKLTGNAVLNQDVSTAGSPTFGGSITIPNGSGLGDGNVIPYVFTAGHQAQITGANSSNFSVNLQNTATGTTQQIAQYQISAAAPNNGTAWFWQCIDNSATRMTGLSNGGLANFSANNVNLSDARVKPSFEQYTDSQIDAFQKAFCAVDWGRFKYGDQTHDDWNHGYTAQGVRAAFEKIAPELVDSWTDGKLLAVYNEDLKNIGMALLARLIRDVAEIKRRLK